MEQKSPDETRWLARVLAIFCILLAFQVINVKIRQISNVNALSGNPQLWGCLLILLGLAIAVFLFWLAYRLFRCSSLWTLSSWFSEKYPMFELYQCFYFRINKHVRGGLVGGVIFLIMVAPLPYILIRYDEIYICEFVNLILFGIILWPIMATFDFCNIDSIEPVLAFPVVIIYLFLVGFCIGAAISCLTSQVRQILKKRACKVFVAPEP